MKAAEQLIAINIVKSIILLNLQDPGNPIELTFQTVRLLLSFSATHFKGALFS